MSLSKALWARIPARSFLSEFISAALQNIALMGFGYWGYQRFYLATWEIYDSERKHFASMTKGHSCFGHTPYWATFRYAECLYDLVAEIEHGAPVRALDVYDVRLAQVQEIDGRSYEFIKSIKGAPLRNALGLVE